MTPGAVISAVVVLPDKYFRCKGKGMYTQVWNIAIINRSVC